MSIPVPPVRTLLTAQSLTVHDLASHGVSRHRASRLVSSGALLRLRKGRYAWAGLDDDIARAARLGGRLDCVSLLKLLGVFVRVAPSLHAQFEPGTTRLPPRSRDTVAHWRTTDRDPALLVVSVVDALVSACRCQSPRDAIATLDNAWHSGVVDETGIAEVFRRLPRRMQVLRTMLDPRSESGAETLVRLMLRSIGASIELQVEIEGVGRVDIVVDGWLIIECDSRAHHEGWMPQKRDRRRDLAAAALGYTTIRPVAEDIFTRPDRVQRLIADTLAHRHGHNSTDSGRARASGSRRARR